MPVRSGLAPPLSDASSLPVLSSTPLGHGGIRQFYVFRQPVHPSMLAPEPCAGLGSWLVVMAGRAVVEEEP